jgi:hypothetical protein
MLVSDTVGFIKKLPHDLVASFRSTLAEALEASLLLFVVDASDPTYESRLEVSRQRAARDRRGGCAVAPAPQQDRPCERGRSRRPPREAPRRNPSSPRIHRRTWPRCVTRSSRSSKLQWWMTRSCCRTRSRGCSAMCTTRARALRGLRHHRPDHEGSRPARRHRSPAKNARRFVSSMADRSVLPFGRAGSWRKQESRLRSGQRHAAHALPLIAYALPRRGIDVRFAPNKQTPTGRIQCDVPKPAVSNRNKQHPYSITSSAMASRPAGIVMPSVVAVLRLITNSNLVGSCTGSSAGFSPLRMRSA